jgi:hypothetical protein
MIVGVHVKSIEDAKRLQYLLTQMSKNELADIQIKDIEIYPIINAFDLEQTRRLAERFDISIWDVYLEWLDFEGDSLSEFEVFLEEKYDLSDEDDED